MNDIRSITAAADGERSDATLLAAWRAGDSAAFDHLYGRYRREVYGFLVRLLGNHASADDVYQELWLQIIERASAAPIEYSLRTWIFTLARSRALDRIRRDGVRAGGSARHPSKRAAAVDPEDPAGAYSLSSADIGAMPSPDAARLQAERAALLQEALAQLPEDQRVVFLMREEGELSLPDAAAALGIPYETAKSRYRYALSRLRAWFGISTGGRTASPEGSQVRTDKPA